MANFSHPSPPPQPKTSSTAIATLPRHHPTSPPKSIIRTGRITRRTWFQSGTFSSPTNASSSSSSSSFITTSDDKDYSSTSSGDDHDVKEIREERGGSFKITYTSASVRFRSANMRSKDEEVETGGAAPGTSSTSFLRRDLDMQEQLLAVRIHQRLLREDILARDEAINTRQFYLNNCIFQQRQQQQNGYELFGHNEQRQSEHDKIYLQSLVCAGIEYQEKLREEAKNPPPKSQSPSALPFSPSPSSFVQKILGSSEKAAPNRSKQLTKDQANDLKFVAEVLCHDIQTIYPKYGYDALLSIIAQLRLWDK